ncbi:hypothetical protein F1559_000051 [Cyanidiococcus yangmingshanensis]|uniref:PIPK domain-containing protein n=1 Tax=Cyanidiococcus yangmingshanensis TaxID=2690220 RepID=A0A7J7IHM6_9RHOD|nr:hypothetical protein F1559_000051 [Cyanidiococcus yangmingshanensis]
MGNIRSFLYEGVKDTEILGESLQKQSGTGAAMARTTATQLDAADADLAVAEALTLASNLNGSLAQGAKLETAGHVAESTRAGTLMVSTGERVPLQTERGQVENASVANDGQYSAKTSQSVSTENHLVDWKREVDTMRGVRAGRLRRPPPLQVAVASYQNSTEPPSPVLVLVGNADIIGLDSGASSASTTGSGSSEGAPTGTAISTSPSALSTGPSAATSGSLNEMRSFAPVDGSVQTPQDVSSMQSPYLGGSQISDRAPGSARGADEIREPPHQRGSHRRTQRRRVGRGRASSLLPPPLPPMIEPAVHTYVDALPAMPPKSPLPGSARGSLLHVGYPPENGPCHSARVTGTYNLLHPFTRRGNFQIRHGEVIFKGHRSYHLMIQIKAGIRYTVERQNALASRNLCMADFRTTTTTRFPALGSADTPPIEKGFTFKDYAPMVFRHLRQRYGITAASYLRSLCGQEALREATTPGKSGSLFYYSSDDRFILKTLSKQEATVLLSILPQYYFHMMKNPESLITRFFGLHRITTHRLGLRRRRIRIVVMSNFLPTRTPIHLRYDLKGSTHGRFSRTPASLMNGCRDDDEKQQEARRRRPSLIWRAQPSDPRQPRKDLDLFRDGVGPIAIDRRLRRRMLNQIDMDCLFLESVHIMDYSFLLGLHRMETSTNAPMSADTRRTPADPSDKTSNSWVGILRSGEQVRLFFGIIDVLDRYNTEKQLEHCWKARILCLQDTISVIAPSSYARRFRNFLEKAFVPLSRTPRSVTQTTDKLEER